MVVKNMMMPWKMDSNHPATKVKAKAAAPANIQTAHAVIQTAHAARIQVDIAVVRVITSQSNQNERPLRVVFFTNRINIIFLYPLAPRVTLGLELFK